MNNRRRILTVSAFLVWAFIAPSAAAGEKKAPVKLSLKEAEKMAVANSEEIDISKQELEKTFNTYREVRSSIMPQVSANYTWNRYLESPVLNINLGAGPTQIPLRQDWEMNFGVTVSQVVFAFGKIINAIELARESLSLRQEAVDMAHNEIRFAVKQAYYSILLAQETLNIARQSHSNAMKNKAAMKSRFRDGRISRVNNVKMEADIASRVPGIMQAREQLDEIKHGFRDMLGLEANRELELSSGFITDFPDYSYDLLEGRMVENQPGLLLLEKSINISRKKKDIEKSQFYPTIAGYLNLNYSGEGDKPVIESSDINEELVAGIRLDYNIWDSGARRSRYKQARNDLNIAKKQYQQKLSEYTVNLRSLLSGYSALRETYQANLEAQRLAEESYNITLASYRSGQVSLTMLNDAELGLTGARMQTMNTLYRINIIMASIEKLIAESGR